MSKQLTTEQAAAELKQQLTREEAVAEVKRLYESYNDMEGWVDQIIAADPSQEAQRPVILAWHKIGFEHTVFRAMYGWANIRFDRDDELAEDTGMTVDQARAWIKRYAS